MSGDGSSLGPRRPPHITVNSGSGGNLLDFMQSENSHITNTANTSRRLYPPSGPESDESSGSAARRALYGAPADTHSSEMLLPPSRTRGPRQYYDLPPDSRSPSAQSSRRTSFSSDGGRSRESRHGPFVSPFDDSRTPSRAGSSDDEGINTQTVAEKYNIMPSAGLLLYPEDVEKDDWLHNPDPNDPDKIRCDIWNKRGLVNVGGLAFITLGILVLFVGYPIMYVFAVFSYDGVMRTLMNYRTFVQKSITKTTSSCATDPVCLSNKVPLLKNQRTGLIDPDTPQSAMNKVTHDGVNMQLVVCINRTRIGGNTKIYSFLTNSTRLVEPSIPETIRILKLSISGMERHKILSGMIRMLYPRTTELSISDLMRFRAIT